MNGLEANQRIDEEQLTRAAAGDRTALADLLTRHGRGLHRFFRMEVGDEEWAQDLVQEVFVRVLRSRQRMPRDAGFRPWLWKIALNLGRNARRRRSPLGVPISFDEPGVQERLSSPGPSPHHVAERSQRATLLMAAVARLEPAQRDVIHLKHFQNLPCAEVARILGISEGTVWSRNHRALLSLQHMLGDALGPGRRGTK